MNITINSRKLGQPVDFYRPGRGYVFVDLSGDGSKPGTLGCQICDGGKLTGRTISYCGENEAVFSRICRGWFRAYLRREALV